MDIKVKTNTFESGCSIVSAPEASCKAKARRMRAVTDEPRITPCSASGSYIHEENGGAALAAATHKPIANLKRMSPNGSQRQDTWRSRWQIHLPQFKGLISHRP